MAGAAHPSDDGFARVRAARYVLLTTFRRDGTPVPTPVWAVPVETAHGPGIRIWSGLDTGKVKRIRAGARVEVAPCSMRGLPTGAAVPATARLLDDAGIRATLDGLVRRYGWQGRIVTARARRRIASSVGIEVTPIP